MITKEIDLDKTAVCNNNYKYSKGHLCYNFTSHMFGHCQI